MSDLELVAVLGEGAFGLVRLVRSKRTGEVYALKQMQKARIVAMNQTRNVVNEKTLLSKLKHPFILRYVKAFKNRDCLYLLTEYCAGGDLFGTLLRAGGTLRTADARWYAACVTTVLEHLHNRRICYRDLKPENLLLDAQGYLKAADFGFAKVVTDRTYTLCGTPEYLAPEIIQSKGHGHGVDWWALGVLVYEMLVGCSPFADPARNEQVTIYKNILRGDFNFPHSLRDPHARDLIRRLLAPVPSLRLGCLKDGAAGVKRHRFFEGMDFDALLRGDILPPIKPKVSSPADFSNFDDFEDTGKVEPYRDDGSHWDAAF